MKFVYVSCKVRIPMTIMPTAPAFCRMRAFSMNMQLPRVTMAMRPKISSLFCGSTHELDGFTFTSCEYQPHVTKQSCVLCTCNALKMSSYVIAHSSLLLQVGSELSGTRFEEEVSEEGVGGELHDIGSSMVLVRLRVRQVDHLLHEAQALLRILVRGSLNRIICRENQCPV